MEFMLHGVQPAELIGRIKGEFRICGWKKNGLHYGSTATSACKECM